MFIFNFCWEKNAKVIQGEKSYNEPPVPVTWLPPMSPSPSSWQPFSSMASPLTRLALLEYFEANFRHLITLPKNILAHTSKNKDFTLNITTIPLSYLKVNACSLIVSNSQSVFRSPMCLANGFLVSVCSNQGPNTAQLCCIPQCVFQVPPPPSFLCISFQISFFLVVYVLRMQFCRVAFPTFWTLLMHPLTSLHLALSLSCMLLGWARICLFPL